jgi:type VI secretion system secreted protein Hcp
MADLGLGNMLQSPSLSVDTKPKDSLQAMYIQIDGIKGESMDKAHKDWIDVLSFGYAVSQSSSMSSGGGGGTGRANFSDLVFTHYCDIATPNLMQYCAKGTHISKVVVSCTKAGGGQQEYFKITLNQVFITHVRIVGATNSPRVIEEVGMSYEKIEVETKKQNPDGSMGAGPTAMWNVKENG